MPDPLFAPRAELATVSADGWTLNLLGDKRPLKSPIEWHPRDLEIGTRLTKLHLHYMEFVEALPDSLFVTTIEDWIRSNDFFRPSHWLDNWNSYAVSIRCVVWMQELARRKASESFPREFLENVNRSLHQQLLFLEKNLEFDIRGNHIVKNLRALLWAAAFFEGRDAVRWGSIGESLLAEELSKQILSDGVHFERSPSYHCQVLADFLECLHVLAPVSQQRKRLEVVCREMMDALLQLTHPDGLVSLFNDGGLHMTYAPSEILRVFKALCGHPPPFRERTVLPQAGYYGIRDRSSFLLMDCGPLGADSLPAHAHGDALAFEWTVEGRRIFVDAGVFEYNAGAERTYSRGTRAHNTVTVADEDQSEFWGAFRVGRRAKTRLLSYSEFTNGFELTGQHDGYTRLEGKPIHIRRMAATPREVKVYDIIEGGSMQPVHARILLHPDCTMSQCADKFIITSVDVKVALRTDALVSWHNGWWSPDLGQRIQTTQIVLYYGVAPCRGTFALTVVD